MNYKEYALTIVRLIPGMVFTLHGAQKVFGIFGGPGLHGYTQWAGTLGVSVPMGYMSALCEFVGGVMLLTGFAAEIGALMTMGMMFGAIYLVHWPHGFFIQNNGFEYALNLILLDVAVILGGPGYFYLWDPFKFLRK